MADFERCLWALGVLSALILAGLLNQGCLQRERVIGRLHRSATEACRWSAVWMKRAISAGWGRNGLKDPETVIVVDETAWEVGSLGSAG